VAQREKERKNEREEVSLTNEGMSEKEPCFFRGFRRPGKLSSPPPRLFCQTADTAGGNRGSLKFRGPCLACGPPRCPRCRFEIRNDELGEQNLVAQREKERKNEREEVSLTNEGMSEKEPCFFRGFRRPGKLSSPPPRLFCQTADTEGGNRGSLKFRGPCLACGPHDVPGVGSKFEMMSSVSRI
jgi:hypothetical protein